jgi:hypothetical protein
MGLTEVQGQLEKVTGRMKYLQQSSSLSTVTATFSLASREWKPLEVARLALESLLAVLQFLGSVAIFALVFAPLWAPLWIYRRRRALVR